MSADILLKGFFSFLIAIGFGFMIYTQQDGEASPPAPEDKQLRYLPYISGSILPFFITFLAILSVIHTGVTQALPEIAALCVGMFLQISVYYAILILLLPLLRKYFNARVCAMLWMLPNYLYITFRSGMRTPSPCWVISIPGNWIWILSGIWLAGFSAVMLWKTGSHLLFRRRILKSAQPVTDPKILEVWEREKKDANITKRKYKLLSSGAIRTPLSIGLFRRSICVLLPQRTYTPEELAMILRHEIIHISREDSWNKFFLVFCAAIFWFNPLMWLAMRKSAEDLELSCDETVLLTADANARMQYANLLLRTAGDGRGFSTCLSSAASAMRHRLNCIVAPGKRYSGVLTISLVFFALCMTSGYVTISHGSYTGSQVIQPDYILKKVTTGGETYDTAYDQLDYDALTEYLSGLSIQKLAGSYSGHLFSENDDIIEIHYATNAGNLWVQLSGNYLRTFGYDRKQQVYYVPGGFDWPYLKALYPPIPSLKLELKEENQSTHHLTGTMTYLEVTTAGQSRLIRQRTLGENEGTGIFGAEPESCTLDFSMEVTSPITILVQSWDCTESYEITISQAAKFSFHMPPYAAHYTVSTTLVGENESIYKVCYHFDVGYL